MIAALVYLTRRSMLNAVRWRARRLRRPRYLLVALGLVIYVASTMFNRPPDGVLGMVPVGRGTAYVIAAAVATLVMGLGWVLPVGGALRFTQAEVHFLFTAPITRRQLLGYKIVRLLIGSVGVAAILALFLAPPRLAAAMMFAVRSAVVFATLALHEAGVSLYRTNAKEQGTLRGRRRLAVLAAACAVTPLIGWALARVALAPTASDLLRALPVAGLLLGVNALWVLRSDAAFEEAAAQQAEKLQQAFARGAIGPPRVRSVRTTPFELAPRGPVETAILWKNWLLFGRASRSSLVGSAIGLVGLAAGLFVAIVVGDEGEVAVALSLFLAALAMLVALMGPAMLRIDLRQDLANLAILKSWPVRGAAIVRGETLAPAIALTAAAAVLIAIACALPPRLPWNEVTGAAGRVAAAVAGMAAAGSLIVAHLVIQNGIAVAFPAWARPTPAAGAGGLEAMGHVMVAMYGALFVLALAAVVPAAVAAAVFLVTGGLLVPSAVFAVLLLTESLAATEAIGRLLERTDLQDVIVD